MANGCPSRRAGLCCLACTRCRIEERVRHPSRTDWPRRLAPSLDFKSGGRARQGPLVGSIPTPVSTANQPFPRPPRFRSLLRKDFASIAASLFAVPHWGVRTRAGIRDIHRSTIMGHGIPSFDLPRAAPRWHDRALSQCAFSAGGPQETELRGLDHVDDRLSSRPALRLVRLVLFVSARYERQALVKGTARHEREAFTQSS